MGSCSWCAFVGCVAFGAGLEPVVVGAECSKVGVAVVVAPTDVVYVGGWYVAALAVVDPLAAVFVALENASADASPVFG